MKQDEQEAGITFLSLPNPTFFFFSEKKPHIWDIIWNVELFHKTCKKWDKDRTAISFVNFPSFNLGNIFAAFAIQTHKVTPNEL